MTAIILLVGLSNILLGYALATLFGLGPHGLASAGDGLAVEVSVPTAAEETPGPPAEETGSVRQTRSTDLLDRLMGTSGDDAAQSNVASSNVASSFPGADILPMNVALEGMLARTTETDGKLREEIAAYDLPTIQGLCAELGQKCRAYLQQQQSASRQLQERLRGASGGEALADQLQSLDRQHTADVERLLAQLHDAIPADAAQAGSWLLGETTKLLSAWHTVRDGHQTLFLAAARQAGQLNQLLDSQQVDGPTGLQNRIGMEALLEEALTAGRPAQQSVCAALFDMDQLGTLNKEQGSHVGDHVLYHVGQHLQGALDPDCPIGRVSGQRFLLLTVGQGERNTARMAHSLRQGIATFVFEHGARQSRVTASVALTELTPDDTCAALWQRLEAALTEAKRSGGNQLVIHDGVRTAAAPTPAEPTETREVLV